MPASIAELCRREGISQGIYYKWFNHSKLSTDRHNHINGIENFWNLGHVVKFSSCVRPTIRQLHVLAGTLEQAVVTSITIDLQDTTEALQNIIRIFAPTSWCIGKCHTRRGVTAPRPIIASQSPEVARLRFSTPRIQHRGCSLVHEQLAGLLEVGKQALINWAKFISCLPDPRCQCGAIQIDALSRIDLGLAIEWQMVSVFTRPDSQ